MLAEVPSNSYSDSMNSFRMRRQGVAAQAFKSSYALLLVILAVTSHLIAQSETNGNRTQTFRWIDEASDAQLWGEVQFAFHDELAPDDVNDGKDALDVYRYKYLRRVGIINHSALVFVGHRPAKQLTKENAWDEYYSAYNFDTDTHRKGRVEHAEWMWKMNFRKLAPLGPLRIPDVPFTYLSCTECEPELIFASPQYDSQKFAWHIRSWENGKDPWWAAKDGLIVGMDVNNGGDTLSFECVYGVLPSERTGFYDVAIRCKEVSYGDSGKLKIDDSTIVYSSSGGAFKGLRLIEFSKIAFWNARMCQQDSNSLLCKLPFYLTATSGQNAALHEMFPSSPKTARDFANFRNLRPNMSMNDVVKRCGEPDELGGSGISIFIYHLDDGSLITIGATHTNAPILYATREPHRGGWEGQGAPSSETMKHSESFAFWVETF